MPIHKFTVDAELLRELGERLVGRPHIALAELIKNSYDADASLVRIEFSRDHITVSDDGHGMSEKDFVDRWMRVGTTRKRDDRVSPARSRTLTGSKGVGRLAAQLLARDIEITSTALSDLADPDGGIEPAVSARIDWRTAVRAGDLTDIPVDVRTPEKEPSYPSGAQHGTTVTLRALTDTWDSARFRALAEEVWALQPPFDADQRDGFRIELSSPYPDVTEAFDSQMQSVFDIWTARVSGCLLPIGTEGEANALPLPSRLPSGSTDEYLDAEVDERVESEDERVAPATQAHQLRALLPTRVFEATVTLRDGPTRTVRWRVDQCEVDQMEFEFLVFELRYRQPKGIRVGVARDYLRRFGGVSIFDNGFRLPYYGAENDWLAVEHDFAARLVASNLVPKALAVPRGLLSLPRNEQLFGRVAVSTNHEQQVRSDLGYDDVPGLAIQVTRDRLADNDAYEQLRVMTRATVDLYAMEKARADMAKVVPPREASWEPPAPTSTRLTELRTVLQVSAPEIPKPVYHALETAVEEAVNRAEQTESTSRAYASVLGALATAGMTSLAYEHEMSKQVRTITSLARRLGRLLPSLDATTRPAVEQAVDEMSEWARRAGRIRQVFKPLVSRETREKRDRLLACRTIVSVAKQAEALAGGVNVDASGVPDSLLLPEATYPAWSSIFQNILVNAYNAMLDVADPRLVVTGGGDDVRGWIEFRDNGAGVDLDTADELWEPFERRLALPAEREDAGLGGMGLGLTIIRMVSDEIGVRVRFVRPPEGFNTSVRIDWKGKS